MAAKIDQRLYLEATHKVDNGTQGALWAKAMALVEGAEKSR